MAEEKKYALLIDSDNISAKYISAILSEMTKYGVVTYKRIYGDWTSSCANKWKDTLAEYSISPIQQFANTVGKNATDSTMIIDAMDILYQQNVDGFCIVSSDSDFTRLASRLRESGMSVIGMGEKKTPRSFRSACTIFTNLELILDHEVNDEQNPMDSHFEGNTPVESNQPSNNKEEPTKETDEREIESFIVDIIAENENNGRDTGLGEVGSRLVKKYPDFDVRSFGYSLLSKFIESIPSLQLQKVNSTVTVSLKDCGQEAEEIVDYIVSAVKKAGKKGVDLCKLSNLLHQKYPAFNVKDFGYSKLYKFVEDIDAVEVKLDSANKKTIFIKTKAKSASQKKLSK